MVLKHLIVGAGAIGSCLAAYLTDIKKDVTLIARGETLRAIQSDGLHLQTRHADFFVPVRAVAEEEYDERPDVVIIAVKSYDVDSIIPLLDRVCGERTMILPIINSVNIWESIAAQMARKPVVLGGAAYVVAVREAPGVVRQRLPFFRIVFGPMDGKLTPDMWKVRQDLLDAGLACELIGDPIQGALRKFVRVSTVSAVQAYYDCDLGGIREHPARTRLLIDLAEELVQIANVRGTPFADDPLEDLLTHLRDAPANYRTSLKQDIDAGRCVEFKTMFFDVCELGRRHGLEMKAYGEVSRQFGWRG
jgi:2-dehydropantoate 2-reductase